MKHHLKLLLVGDVMLGRLVNERLRNNPPEHPWGDTLPLFHGADWRACNLECVISDHGMPWARSPKAFHFQSDARHLGALTAAQMDVVSLANNHSLDFNHRGMVEMVKLLDAAGIQHSGVGLNRAEASRPAISVVQGVRVGFLAFTDNEPAWEADRDHPGIFFVPVETPDERTAWLLDLVRLARAEVDLLVVSAHWGGNWDCHPPPSHIRLAHELIRAGADVIFGHSPHVCRGVEVFEGGVILYSTGDFVDDYAVDPLERNDRSWVFEVHVHNWQVSHLHLYPTVIHDCQARLAGPDVATGMIDAMQELCAQLGTITSECLGPHRLAVEVREQPGLHLNVQEIVKWTEPSACLL